MNGHAVLLISCPDQKGIVARLSDFIFKNKGNIVHSDQHTDAQEGIFFIRLEWELDGFAISPDQLPAAFASIAKEFKMDWDLRFTNRRSKMAVFVSQKDHCLIDLLYRQKEGELAADLAMIVSNHDDQTALAKSFGVPYHHLPITPKTKETQEKKQLELLKKSGVDLIVLARYMQIVSKEFIDAYPNKIINIHHSFLPAFKGGKPYEQAHSRGVKIIGATSHYVTEELDAGPIIEQDVARVSHRDTVADLVRKGKDLEKSVLSRAVRWHLDHRILAYRNKTVVFD